MSRPSQPSAVSGARWPGQLIVAVGDIHTAATEEVLNGGRVARGYRRAPVGHDRAVPQPEDRTRTLVLSPATGAPARPRCDGRHAGCPGLACRPAASSATPAETTGAGQEQQCASFRGRRCRFGTSAGAGATRNPPRFGEGGLLRPGCRVAGTGAFERRGRGCGAVVEGRAARCSRYGNSDAKQGATRPRFARPRLLALGRPDGSAPTTGEEVPAGPHHSPLDAVRRVYLLRGDSVCARPSLALSRRALSTSSTLVGGRSWQLPIDLWHRPTQIHVMLRTRVTI
jgi:hypothetical protein